MKKDEIFSVIVLFLFGAVTTILSLKMDIGTFRNAGTGMFPLFLGVLLMILSSIFLLRIFFQNKKAPVKSGPIVEIPGSTKQMIFFLGAMVLATLFFNKLGYPLTSFLMMVGLLRILGIKRWGLNILISVVTAVGSYFLFVQWLNIPMPKGWIGL
jgi:putative tricarboxylic transport membrane protein